MKQLRLYYRSGCHLCEDMETHLEQLSLSWVFDLDRVDVDSDPGVKERYNHRVPVLEDVNGATLSEYFLDQAAVLRYLQSP
ncbi:MAG: glutaredoxin family protein [Candidatus Thiodiazotropha sp. (ex Notomyrtea botanica)]|nr:glutaredoxin family protein [Candidatus Thiodiazotropha sp. (ex Notomyrtea botanica)]